MRNSLLFCTIVFVSCQVTVRGLADEKLVTLSKKATTIVDKYGVSLTATAHLGALPKGTRGIVLLELKNDTAEEIRIDRVKASSACLSPRDVAKTIAPGGMGSLEFILETPSQSVQQEISVSAILVSSDGRDVRLNVRYMIEGVLALTTRVAVIDVNTDEEVQRFEIPIIYTPPVSPGQIKVTVEKQLEPIAFSVREKGQRASLLGEFPLSALETGGLSGRVFVEHPATRQKFPVEIRHTMPGNVKRGDEIVSYDKMRFVTLHWFSVNQGLPEDTQTIDLNDLQSLEKLVDPKKTRATRILEKL